MCVCVCVYLHVCVSVCICVCVAVCKFIEWKNLQCYVLRSSSVHRC